VAFRFSVSPPSDLYRRTEFRISFPPQAVDVGAVPMALWWRVLLFCLHAHFALLAPATVELPIGLPPAERKLWERLIANVSRQLDAYGRTPRPGRHVTIADSGPVLAPARLPTAGDRAAVTFSGGKDSLVLAALLAELTERPLLVTITSPVPWARDHVGAARERALNEIGGRLPVEAIEVTSDFRTSWDYTFSARDGCTLGVHELSDLPLYYGAMAAVAAARRVGSCFMASEADIQYNRLEPSRPHRRHAANTLLHREFLSCFVTQRAWSAVLEPFGIRQESLSYPLHMPQVEALLLGRYRHVADLQFSCWRAPPGAQACSSCAKCFLVALVALSEGISPSALGIDAAKVLREFADWSVNGPGVHAVDAAAHPFRRPMDQRVRALQRTPTASVAAILRGDATAGSERYMGDALAIYARMRAEAFAHIPPPEIGYVTAFLDLVPARLRPRLEEILGEHFPPTTEPEFAAMAQRARALADWIIAPMAAAREQYRATENGGSVVRK
jgi:hypothetical protein